jgi:hypothetical protein
MFQAVHVHGSDVEPLHPDSLYRGNRNTTFSTLQQCKTLGGRKTPTPRDFEQPQTSVVPQNDGESHIFRNFTFPKNPKMLKPSAFTMKRLEITSTPVTYPAHVAIETFAVGKRCITFPIRNLLVSGCRAQKHNKLAMAKRSWEGAILKEVSTESQQQTPDFPQSGAKMYPGTKSSQTRRDHQYRSDREADCTFTVEIFLTSQTHTYQMGEALPPPTRYVRK